MSDLGFRFRRFMVPSLNVTTGIMKNQMGHQTGSGFPFSLLLCRDGDVGN